VPRPAKPWFRFYSEQLESRKAQALRHEDPVLYGYWINIICIANLQKTRGILPPIDDIVFALRPDPAEDVKAAISNLTERHFLDKKGSRLAIHDWDDWQKDSDVRRSSSADETSTKRRQNYGASSRKRSPRSDEEEKQEKKRSEEIGPQNPLSLDGLVAEFATFGNTNMDTASLIEEAVGDHSLELVQHAIKQAKGSQARRPVSWNYVVRILEDPKHDYRGPANGVHHSEPDSADEIPGAALYGLDQPRRIVSPRRRLLDAGGASDG
jgi:hypothetical protein